MRVAVSVLGVAALILVSVVPAGNPARAQSAGWVAMAPLPVAKTGLVAVTGANGLIYVFGGTDNATQDYSDAEVYDPTSNVWRGIAPLPVAEAYPSAVLGLDGKIYIFGGFNSLSGQSLNNVFAYDASTNTYACSANYAGCTSSSLAPMPTARSVMAIAETFDGKIWTIGGYTNTAVAGVEEYDPAANAWTEGPALPTAESGASAVVLPLGQLVVFGGFNGQRYNDQSVCVLPALASTGSPALRDFAAERSRPVQIESLSGPVICIPPETDPLLQELLHYYIPIWNIEYSKETAQGLSPFVQDMLSEAERLAQQKKDQIDRELAMEQAFIRNAYCRGHEQYRRMSAAQPYAAHTLARMREVRPASIAARQATSFTLPPVVIAGGKGTGGVTASVQINDWLNDTSTAGPSLPGPREAAAQAYGVNGTVYVIGGDDGTNLYNTVFAYTPQMLTIPLSASSTPSPSPSPIPTSTPLPLPTSTPIPPAATATATASPIPPTPTPARSLFAGLSESHASVRPHAKQKIVVHTLPGASVAITVTYPDKRKAHHRSTANRRGTVSWSYKQPAGVTAGKKHTAKVTAIVRLGADRPVKRHTKYHIT